MTKQYINIAISGLSINDAEELKSQLCNIVDKNISIQWKTATDINLDCLFIHENFFESEGIQRILNTRRLPWLKVGKDDSLSGKVENNTLYLPLENSAELNQWVESFITQTSESVTKLNTTENKISATNTLPENSHLTESFFKELHNAESHHKLHIYDSQGSFGVIDIANNLVYGNPDRSNQYTDFSFNYDFASTSDLIKVSRKHNAILQDWIWNLFWRSPNFYQIAPEDGHYRIHFWPKPEDLKHRKEIFQMSACFIQGAKMSKIAEQHNISMQMIRQFIAANMAAGNISKINIWDNHYTPPEKAEEKPEENMIKSFFGKLRKKFGF
ncbi:hypothetical protein [Acinetobacter sp. ANC 3813]|uniref:hypothetical protein n=1 Tax=Acinetobacter sp. ANC 3813 TaxID=1977873 RepID=UPI000A3499D2|nr:hypothetical protein [Acinetobacter sp. ANC 3813]OTG90568.1 hypothetical protein B9T34_08730 [Acinetobacter sp. ANC 3813]